MKLDIGIEGLREIEKWLPSENESTARERLRQLAQDRDDAWRLASGWRHPAETDRAWTDLCTAMTRLAGAWLEVEGALAAYRATKTEKVWGPERMRHDPERTA